MKIEELIEGERFSRLVIIKEVSPKIYLSGQKKRSILCKCDCGNEKIIVLESLKKGATKSCGCLQKELATKHNMINTTEYIIWNSMKNRCYNTNNPSYENYGGRGIIVCDRWLKSFENFYEDVGKRPSKNHTIDRINNNLNYTKDNIKWSTMKEQNRNQRKNVLITYNNETLCLSEISEKYNINRSTLDRRLRLGWSIEKALETPVRFKTKFIYD